MSLEHFIQQFSQALANGNLYSLLIAAGAGIITTGVCPCTLPVGLGIAGLVSSNTENKTNRGFMIALGFFCGIVVCLSVLGALAGRLGVFFTETFGQYWALSMALISVTAIIKLALRNGLSLLGLITNEFAVSETLTYILKLIYHQYNYIDLYYYLPYNHVNFE